MIADTAALLREIVEKTSDFRDFPRRHGTC
jgi:hypothetical protein